MSSTSLNTRSTAEEKGLETIWFENVGYKVWNVTDGCIALKKQGFMYQAPGENGRKLKFKWASMTANPLMNPAGSTTHVLKIFIRGTPYVFRMKDRGDLEEAKEIISRRLEPILFVSKEFKVEEEEEEEEEVREDSLENARDKNSSTYPGVSHSGQDGGSIVLTEKEFAYYSPHGNGKADVHLPWKSIYKFKINSASQEAPLPRIVSSGHVSYLFQMRDRIALERIKKDIKGRRIEAARTEARGRDDALRGSDVTGQLTISTAGNPLEQSSPLRKSHGANSGKGHEAVKPCLGSFGRIVGPAADMRELEYISSLHQNVEKILRSDGTISSQDLIPYLASRYGVTITTDQAIDIVCNLCGGKPRNEFSAEQDARNDELHNPEPMDDDTDEEEENEDEQEIYYFDLVQVMSLLMIPEILQLSERHGTLSAKDGDKPSSTFVDLSSPVSFLGEELNEKGSCRLSEKAVGVVQVVIDQLIEIFDEDLRNDFRRGSPLDADMLRTILQTFGDVDACNDPHIVQQMLGALGESPSLTVDNFLRALTSDVRTYATSDSLASKQGGKQDSQVAMSSTFYDVFGFNWDHDTREKEEKETPATFPTASFIDYAADTYRSVVHNTSLWCLFILTTMIYLNFFLNYIKTETGGLICSPDTHFGCAVGNKIIGWIITAVFCGFYGVFFIVPTSMGNVHGRTVLLLVTFIITAVLTYAPFSTLIWYQRGMPWTTTITHDYRVICPAWSEFSPQQADAIYNTTEDQTQYYLHMDGVCRGVDAWCEAHPEVQGKYLDQTPGFLTYDEFEKCYNFLSTAVLVEFSDLWTVSGEVCDPNNTTSVCPGNGACARSDLSDDAPYICCHSLTSEHFELNEEEINETVYDEVCASQPPGATCLNDYMCESQICENNVCAPSAVEDETDTITGMDLGAPCERSNLDCKSGFCDPKSNVCQPKPLICPVDSLKWLGGYRLDPFCRTAEDWCTINAVDTLRWNLFQAGFQLPVEGDSCSVVLEAFEELTRDYDVDLIKVLNESDAAIGDTYVVHHLNDVEVVLDYGYAYFVLLAIAIVGAFALIAELKGLLCHRQSSERPRDYRMKCAAIHKMGNLIENALSMHMVEGASTKGQVMRNYFLKGDQVVEVGGLVWTMKGMWSCSLFYDEGLGYTGRLWIGQVTQVVVAIIEFAFSIEFVKWLADQNDDIRKELNDNYTPDQVKGISNYEWPTLTRDDLTVTEQEQTLLDFMPERWMIEAAGYLATAISLLVSIYCILVYVPSYTNTVLKLRSGMIASLHDPGFSAYRNTADNVVPNIGNMVFAMVGAAFWAFCLTFVIVFLFAWPQTRGTALGWVAVAIGIICTMIIKIVGQKLLRKRNFSAFYRKRPRCANYANLFFECWYLGTSLLVVVKRCEFNTDWKVRFTPW